MNKLTLKTIAIREMLKDMLKDEQGQDLIEYALVVALIAFGATAAMTTLSTDINAAFTGIGTKLTTAMS